MINWNDSLETDAERDRILKPLIPMIIGTRSTKEIELKRSYLAFDWLIRTFASTWLDQVPALKVHAEKLRNLNEITDSDILKQAKEKINAARAATRAAWAATRAAALAAAGAAAGAIETNKLKPTVDYLQASAVELVHRMIELRQ